MKKWFSGHNRHPLVIRGARQVGKSTLVRDFALAEGLALREINLYRNLDLIPAFRSLDPKRICQEISDRISSDVTAPGGILFLDEISAAPPSVQAAAYQICLDKRVGEHVLPKNTIVICAGNRTSDKAVAYQMPKPLANRLTHFEMVADLDSWKEWAYKEGIDPNIIGFITWRPDYLNKFDPSTDDVAFPTPRSWELVNSYMKIDFDTMFDAISGTVGLETATEFKVFMNFNHKIPQFEDIKAGTADKPNEKDAGLMYALASHIISNVIAEHKDLKEKEKDNIFSYITSFKHDEYIVLIMQDIIKNCKEIIPYLLNNKEIRKFIKNVSDMLA